MTVHKRKLTPDTKGKPALPRCRAPECENLKGRKRRGRWTMQCPERGVSKSEVSVKGKYWRLIARLCTSPFFSELKIQVSDSCHGDTYLNWEINQVFFFLKANWFGWWDFTIKAGFTNLLVGFFSFFFLFLDLQGLGENILKTFKKIRAIFKSARLYWLRCVEIHSISIFSACCENKQGPKWEGNRYNYWELFCKTR